MVYNNRQVADNLRIQVQKLKDQIEAVKEWWLLFKQCIDSEAAKEKLEAILEDKD